MRRKKLIKIKKVHCESEGCMDNGKIPGNGGGNIWLRWDPIYLHLNEMNENGLFFALLV